MSEINTNEWFIFGTGSIDKKTCNKIKREARNKWESSTVNILKGITKKDSFDMLEIKGKDKKKVSVVIPARYKSSRFPGKPIVEIDGIPFIGYTDFHFEDKNTKEDFFIDLKTSKLLPQKISISHAMQQSIYQKATNARQILWYLKNPTKKKDAEYIAMSLDDYSMPMKICEHIVNVMGDYLKTVNSPDDVKNSLIPNPDNWIWKEQTVFNARKEVWGF